MEGSWKWDSNGLGGLMEGRIKGREMYGRVAGNGIEKSVT